MKLDPSQAPPGSALPEEVRVKKAKPKVFKVCTKCGWEDYHGHSQFYGGVCGRCAGCNCWGPGPNPNCPVHVNGW